MLSTLTIVFSICCVNAYSTNPSYSINRPSFKDMVVSSIRNEMDVTDFIQLNLFLNPIYELQQHISIYDDNSTSFAVVNSAMVTVFETNIDSPNYILWLPEDEYSIQFVGVLMSQPCSVMDIMNDSCFGNSLIQVSSTQWDDTITHYRGPVQVELMINLYFLITPLAKGKQECKFYQSIILPPSFVHYNGNDSLMNTITSWPISIPSNHSIALRYSFFLILSQFQSGLEFRFRSATPISVYLNSISIYQDQSLTHRISGQSYIWTTVSVPTHFLIEGKNILAISIQSMIASDSEMIRFDCYAHILTDISYRYLSVNQLINSSSILIDHSLNTQSIGTVSLNSDPIIYSIIYPIDHAESMTSLCFGLLDLNRDFSSNIIITLMNDANEIIMMISRQLFYSIELRQDEGINICWDFNNTLIYHEYKLVFTSLSLTNITFSIGEIIPRFHTFIYNLNFIPYSTVSFTYILYTQCIRPQQSDQIIAYSLFSIDRALLIESAQITLNQQTGEICVQPTGDDHVEFLVGLFTYAGYRYIPMTVIRTDMSCTDEETNFEIKHGYRLYSDQCGYGYEGMTYRECFNGTLSTSVFDECFVLPPTNFSYIVAEKYIMFTSLTLQPTFSNLVFIFTNSSSFPIGLHLNQTTGDIYGVPYGKVENELIVTATNSAGSIVTFVNLSLQYPPCEGRQGQLVEFDETEDRKCYGWSPFGTLVMQCKEMDQIMTWVVFGDNCRRKNLPALIIMIALAFIIILLFIMSAFDRKNDKKVTVSVGDLYI